jgi:hypothetical protein
MNPNFGSGPHPIKDQYRTGCCCEFVQHDLPSDAEECQFKRVCYTGRHCESKLAFLCRYRAPIRLKVARVCPIVFDRKIRNRIRKIVGTQNQRIERDAAAAIQQSASERARATMGKAPASITSPKDPGCALSAAIPAAAIICCVKRSSDCDDSHVSHIAGSR